MKNLLWPFLIILVGLRVLFFYTSRPVYPDGTRLRITERVSSEPIRYSNAQYLKISGYKAYFPLYPEVKFGDLVIVEGVVGGDTLKKPTLLESRKSESFLLSFREQIKEFFQKSLPEPHSSLVAGVVLGSKESIPKTFWDALKETGTSHVVVASGMNVTLVAGFLISLFTVILPRRRAVVFVLLGIWLYCLITGLDAPVVRAAIMGSLVFTAQVLGRLYYALRSLFISASLMLMLKPEWFFDLGFILSFSATLSLFLFEKKVRRALAFVPALFREGLSTSLAAQVGVAPIIFMTFGQFNFLSPIVNALTLWTIAPVTIIGMIAAIVSVFYVPAGKLVLVIAYPLTWWFVSTVQVFASLT